MGKEKKEQGLNVKAGYGRVRIDACGKNGLR